MLEVILLEIVLILAAVTTGGFVWLLALALARVCGWPAEYALIAGAGAALLSWLAWSSRAADILERLTGADRRKPQQTRPKEINLRIHEEKGDYLEGTFLNRLPVGAETLFDLANQVINGQSLTTSAMTGNGIDRATWETLRDRLIASGLLAWRGGNRSQGVEVTARGMAVFRRMAAPTSPSTPPPARLC